MYRAVGVVRGRRHEKSVAAPAAGVYDSRLPKGQVCVTEWKGD